MSEPRRLWPGDTEAGSAGKVLLIIVAIVVLLGVAVVALWRPVIQPLVGDAVPERVVTATEYQVPHDDPQVRVTVQPDWTVQRALYNPEQALIRSPDLSTEVKIDTWEHGASPSLKTAIVEATEGLVAHTGVRVEQLTDTLVGVSVVTSAREGAPEGIVVVVGEGTDDSARATAIFTVTAPEGLLDEVLPAVTELLESVEVNP